MDTASFGLTPAFQTLFESAPGLYLILTPDLKIIAATNKYLEATMTSRESILGRDLFDVFPDNPADANATGTKNLRASLETVISELAPHKMAIQKYDIRLPDSEEFEERFWSPMNSPVLGEDGRLLFIIHHVEDVTKVMLLKDAETELQSEMAERKLAEDERDRFFSLSLDMLCIANADGYFKRVSPAFTRTLGWSPEELTTNPFVDFVHPDDLEATMAEVERQVTAGELVLEFENRYRHKDGSWRTLSWKSIPESGGMMYATARDVTEQKKLEAALLTAKEEAERASAAKGDFLSHMSHELRTPLNAVIGFAQLIQLQSSDSDTLESAKSILKGGRHLLSLVDEILDLAKIEAGKLTISLEPVPLGNVIDQAVHLVAPIAKERGITIIPASEVCAECHVSADRQRLMQVLMNLLTNAVKYNRPGGSVSVSCTKRNDGTHRIGIIDTGVGIDEKGQERLFHAFERGSHSSEAGTGLGLVLSQRLAKLMDGQLSLISTSGEGSVFAIDLKSVSAPSLRTVSETVSPEAPIVDAGDGLRVVYIEDNLSNMQLMERVFKSFGNAQLMPAMQSTVGLQLIEDHNPDLVLLDLHLPDIPGIEVLRTLKSNPRTAQIPVVVLSADATEGQIRRALDAGAKAYLTKPIDLELLIAQLRDVKSKPRQDQLNEVA